MALNDIQRKRSKRYQSMCIDEDIKEEIMNLPLISRTIYNYIC